AVLSFLGYIQFMAAATSSTLSLHDALPISRHSGRRMPQHAGGDAGLLDLAVAGQHARHPRQVHLVGPATGVAEHHRAVSGVVARSEEHTSELQSRQKLVCRLLLEKKKCTTR